MSIFRMISNFKKINFCNFFAHFSPHASPRSFSLSEGILRTTSPHASPAHFPKFLLFQGATFAGEFPSKAYGEIFSQNIILFAKIPYFLLQISACPGVRTGGVRGVNGDKFRDFSAKASPWKGENWGTFGGDLGAV